jgi:PhnB protein
MSTNLTIAQPIIPHLVVDNAAAAIDFYKRAFGAVEQVRHMADDGKRVMHASLSIGGQPLFLADDFPEMCGGKSSTPKALAGTPVTMHLDCPQADTLWAQATAAGASVVLPLADQFWGDRYGIVRDPFGHQWSIATRSEKKN